MKSNKTILDLINKNASVNEICYVTGLSHKQLFYRMNMLKIKGYDFTTKYYSSGDIKYNLIQDLKNNSENSATILTGDLEQEISILFISDLHLGNINERPELLESLYNFCSKKNIHTIINSGDLVEGPIGCGNVNSKKINDVEKQIEYMLNKYPFDKNILNFICLGNHDYACLKDSGLNIHNILKNKRHDLISLGYIESLVNIKNDKILIQHPNNGMENDFSGKELFVVHGHSHKFKSAEHNKFFNIWIPTLSDILPQTQVGLLKQFPSAVVGTFYFKNGYFHDVILEQFIFVNNDMYRVSELEYDLSRGKSTIPAVIKNEENITQTDLSEYEEKAIKKELTRDMSTL